MKGIGILILFLAIVLTGYEWSKWYEKRVHFLQQFIQSIYMIDANMHYTSFYIEQICEEIIQKTSFPVNYFYSYIHTKLQAGAPSFKEIWSAAIYHPRLRTYCTKEDVNLIEQLGKELGFHPYDQQKKHLTWTIHQLEMQLEEAYERKNKYSLVIKAMSVLAGILFIIVII